ncbi:tumor necrosis factor ligand superfamily member 15 [Pelobates cultripes]|uniref:Tumor necrosis factor ligand superfamily member 15 n=1 Tax=Pelobates cultripes TaxID=61616 RepID=A0AAD1T0P5_PELCU|nr:tumor necrosis factor ligand superfamily member 15 [Pelobates cultripes]
MEACTVMPGEECLTSYPSSTRTALDKGIRRLQWTVTCCLIGLVILSLFSVYQMIAGYQEHSKDKGSKTGLSQLLHGGPGMKAVHTSERPRAHLTGTKQDDQNLILQWEDQRGLAFTKEGMTYKNRSLLIPKTGDYFVYSQVSFRASDSSHKNKKLEYVTLQITRVNNNYPEPECLLSGAISIDKEREECQTIYLGALLSMKVGDMVSVKVNDIKLVDVTVDHKTFFGAFLS